MNRIPWTSKTVLLAIVGVVVTWLTMAAQAISGTDLGMTMQTAIESTFGCLALIFVRHGIDKSGPAAK